MWEGSEEELRSQSQSPVCTVFPGIEAFGCHCPGLASWVQLPDPCLKPVLPRCWVPTASLSSFGKQQLCPSCQCSQGLSRQTFSLGGRTRVTFFSLSHSSFKRWQGEARCPRACSFRGRLRLKCTREQAGQLCADQHGRG